MSKIYTGPIPKHLFSTNSKLRRDGIYSFGIPAFLSETGLKTCPAAAACVKGCYARQGFYVMPSVKKAQETRLALSQDRELFVAMADTELRKRKIKRLRIHDSGDFYSWSYLATWLRIIKLNPAVKFYAYTKRIDMFQGIQLPTNFTVIYSYGGKHDHLIKETDRHSQVFSSKQAMRKAGYADATERDIRSIGKSKRIGLVYHGHKSRAWNTKAKAAVNASDYGPKETDIPGYYD